MALLGVRLSSEERSAPHVHMPAFDASLGHRGRSRGRRDVMREGLKDEEAAHLNNPLLQGRAAQPPPSRTLTELTTSITSTRSKM